MDLSNFQSITTNQRTLEVRDPDGELLKYNTGQNDDDGKAVMQSCTITLVSEDSPEYQTIFKRQLTENVQRAIKRSGKAKMTGTQIQNDKMDILVGVTKAWVGFEWNGKDFPFSLKNAREIYTRLPFIKEQVDEFVHERANFLGS